jgi:hypothetical protein
VRLSDRVLRRSAWAVFWFVLVMCSAAVLLSTADEPRTSESWESGGPLGEFMFALVVVTFPATGVLIARRQPRNTIGWLLLGIGLVWGLAALADNYARYGLLLNPGSVPGPDVAAAISEGAWAPGFGLMGTFLVLLYPDGHLPSPRWRPVALLSAATILLVFIVVDLAPGRLEESPVPTLPNPLAVGSPDTAWAVLLVTVPLLPLCIVACAVALVRRFRRSVGIERQQLKWLAAAGAAVAAIYLLTMASTLPSQMTASDAPGWVSALQRVTFLPFILLPLAIGIAILRYRLYDVDVVINRTLVYGSLTVTLAGIYLGSVLFLQLVLAPHTSESDLAVAGSTLAVAALFQPARGRIQRVVDRRFYRARYDSARILEGFSDQLRHSIDLGALETDLRRVVTESMQPQHVSLWLHTGPSPAVSSRVAAHDHARRSRYVASSRPGVPE